MGDLAETFRERWLDPTPLEHQNPLRARVRRFARQPRRPSPLSAMPPDPPSAGKMAVQVLRTYPAKRPPFPFAPRGERSVARAYAKALARARSLIYVEDQYLWSTDVARFFADALRRSPELRLLAVVPKYPDQDGVMSGPLNRIGQQEALAMLPDAGGDRVAVYDLENEAGRPIYVHGKLCVIDDVWMAVGSDNLNRRSWTHDSEAACAVLDSERDERPPVDPGGLGDGARALPRQLRLTLWREHLGPDVSEAELLDPRAGFEAWRRMAHALDAWHAEGQKGPRPGGRAVATTRSRSRLGPRGGAARSTGSRWIQTGGPATSSDPAVSDKPSAQKMATPRSRRPAPSPEHWSASLRLKRVLGLGVILAVVGGGCGSGGQLGAKALSQQSKSLESEAAEGALLAQDAASGRTTRVYTREHSSELHKAASQAEVTLKAAKTEPALEPKLRQLAVLAGQISADLERLGSAARDEDGALARELQAAAQASQKIGEGIK